MNVKAQFNDALKQLLPSGAAYPRQQGCTVAATTEGIAEMLAEHHEFVLEEIRQWYAHSTTKRLPEWEASTGQPDDCALPDQSFEQRRLKVLAVLRTFDGNSKYDNGCPGAPGALEDIALALGAIVTVEAIRPFRAGRNRVGQRLGSNGILVIRVANPNPGSDNPWEPIKRFRAGQHRVGRRLVKEEFAELECVFNKIAPARFQLIFMYEQ